jgi:hypothetical protein
MTIPVRSGFPHWQVDDARKDEGAAITVSPETMADVLEALKLSNLSVPQLRFLVRSMRRQQWTPQLQRWGFSQSDAVRIADGLQEDIDTHMRMEVRCWF